MTNTTSRNRRPGAPQAGFVGICVLLFVASAAVTTAWCAAMSSMGGMPMPGGWTMSMTWMRSPNQSWCGAAASFLTMWFVMMVAMMLPSLTPMLWRYRDAVSQRGEARLASRTATVAAAYFVIWAVLGLAVFVVGDRLAMLTMQRPGLSRAMPIALGVIVVLAGVLQFTSWKAHHLWRCRADRRLPTGLPPGIAAAGRHGLRLGLDCVCSSAGATAVLLGAGVMDLRAMAAVAIATTTERLVPEHYRIAHVIGALAIAAGTYVAVRAAAAA